MTAVAAPVTATLHWLDAGQLGSLVLTVGDVTQAYVLTVIARGHYRLMRADSGTVYHVHPAGRGLCSCPDARYRRPASGCKHVQGLRAALALACAKESSASTSGG
jgi:hypothetical protein